MLGLERRVDARLIEVSSRGASSPLVFLDAMASPNAWRLRGRYRFNADEVAVEVRLVKGERSHRFTVTGKKAAPDAVAAQIVVEVERRLK